LNLVLALAGAVISVIAGLKWRAIRYSAAAILVAPPVIHAAMEKHWLVVEVMVPLMLITILVDVLRARRAHEEHDS
jgi:uncharacterized membrane-anchored protein